MLGLCLAVGFFKPQLPFNAPKKYWDLDTRVPLLTRTRDGPARIATNAIVECVALYPTLAELAGLRPPSYLAGQSLEPLPRDPAVRGRGTVGRTECDDGR